MTVLILSATSALYMLGVGCLVQFVAYPLFADVDAGSFTSFHAAWSSRITPVVLLPMVVELVTAGWLVVDPPGSIGRALPAVGLAFAITAWASTGLLQVPAHSRLSGGFSAEAHRRLLSTSWLRTVAWAGHSVAACLMISAVA